MANIVKTVVAGEVILAADWNAEFANIYAGDIDRTAGRWGANDDIPVTFGSSQDCSLAWNTTQTQNALVLGLGASRSLIICDEADKGTNFAYVAQSDPCVIIHSNSATAANYLKLFHNDTDAYVSTGAGKIALTPAGLACGYHSASATVRSLTFDTVDLGAGYGPNLSLGRNSNASTPSSGNIKITNLGNTDYYLWVDATGRLRIHTSAPTNANDTAGTVVGAQTAP